jgi:arylsulfatase A
MEIKHQGCCRFLKIFILGIISTCLLLLTACKKQRTEDPNIVFIIADDLGYGDLSCYGQTHFTTPNIDQIAKEGIKFTQHYAGSTVCAPSRSVLLTGLHSGHTPIRGNGNVKPEGQIPIPQQAITISQLLKDKNYATGAFGKWGLGFINNAGSPLKHGFDKFYGYYCQSLAHRYYPEYIWDNENKIELKNKGKQKIEYAPDLIHSEALKFIESNKNNKFFLFLPYTLPHAELIVPVDEILQKYRNKYLPEKEYQGSDYGDNYDKRGYCSQKESHAVFAAMISRLDKYVGEILSKLNEFDIAENTIVIFTSDNGPHLEGGADPDFFDSNGPLRGYKRDLFEGGIRVPLLAKWPRYIKAGSVCDHISAFWDILPTLAEITNINIPANTDGISFLPALLGKDNQKKHGYLYWEFHEQGGKQAVRLNNWKGIRFGVHENPDSPILLYDLNVDVCEEHDVSREHPEIVRNIEEIMINEHAQSSLFPFNYEKEKYKF